MLHWVYDQPDVASVNAQIDDLLDQITGPLLAVTEPAPTPCHSDSPKRCPSDLVERLEHG